MINLFSASTQESLYSREHLIEHDCEHQDQVKAQEPEKDFFGGRQIAARAVVFLLGGDELVGLEGGDDGGEVDGVLLIHRRVVFGEDGHGGFRLWFNG